VSRIPSKPYERHQVNEVRDVIIIGSGPAGYTAAVYAARARLHPLVIEGSVTWGGALMTTTDVENYPGFRDGIMGPALMEEMRAQAERFGAEFVTDDAEWVDLTGAVKIVFRDQDIAVVGGGDSAMEEATFLTRFARKVYVIHRRDELRASKVMQERAFANDTIEFVWNTEVVDIHGEDKVSGLTLRNTLTGEQSTLAVSALFVAIGHDPRSDLVAHQVRRDEEGYVLVDHPSTRTDLAGVFAAGDLVDHTYRQAVTAAGTGCQAALDAERYLAAMDDAPALPEPAVALATTTDSY